MSHTPGPWQQYGAEIAAGPDMVAEVNLLNKRIAHQINANAKLIAAAPDLLEALERSRGQWIHSVNAERCLAAIAKAKGET